MESKRDQIKEEECFAQTLVGKKKNLPPLHINLELMKQFEIALPVNCNVLNIYVKKSSF